MKAEGTTSVFRQGIKRYHSQLLLLGVLLLLMILMSSVSEYFFAWKNFYNILDQSAVYIILSVGMTFVIASGGVDLSVGSVAGLGGVTMAVLMKAGMDVPGAVISGIALCVLIGVANGALISFMRINAFIITLVTMIIARGFALILTGGVSIYGFDKGFKWFGTGDIGPVNAPIVISLICAVIGMLLLRRTLWGKYALALGANDEALRRAGVKTRFYRTSIYAVSGLCAAIAGLIMTARLNSAAPLAGQNYEMDAIAAVVLGGASMSGGKGTVLGTLFACLILAVMRNGLTLLAIPTYYQQVVTGLIILAAIVTAEIRNRIQADV
jgi:ribose/xylose/arabinose/galactoside ABC-type transport system permease subunit